MSANERLRRSFQARQFARASAVAEARSECLPFPVR
jgi:hypothetical protein